MGGAASSRIQTQQNTLAAATAEESTMPMILPDPSDPYDLEIVYPGDPNAPNHRQDVDVVAIHGLNLDGSLVHHRDDWTCNTKLWLRDYLPGALSKRCRVMLFSYTNGAKIAEDETNLARHAECLLAFLRFARLEAEDRPLLFICHDIGGLILKDALVTATINTVYKPIADATRLLVFFNTPHRDEGSIAKTIAEAAIHVPTQEIIDKLGYECDELAKRIQRAELTRRLYDKRLVLNLFGTNPHRGEKLLVPRQATILNLPDYWEKQFPIYGDHTSMCKFESGKDEGCQIVVKTIAMEIARALAMYSD